MKKILLPLLALTFLQPSFAKAMEARPAIAMDLNAKKHSKVDHNLWDATMRKDFDKVVQAQQAGAQANAIIWDVIVQN